VLEAKPAPGGRAYSFADDDTRDFVDNGQHVLMGCYAETLDFLGRIGSAKHLVFHDDLEIEMLERGGRSAMLRTARLPGPLHMGAALLRYRHLDMRQRLSAVLAGLRLLAIHRFDRSRLARLTVSELMDLLGQSARARECFWHPIAIATLNEAPERSSALLFAEVLRRAFFARRRDSAFVYSRAGLSELYCSGAAKVIERSGGRVEVRAIVEALEFGHDARLARAKLRDGSRIEASAFVAAVPPQALLRFLPENAVADRFFARLRAIDTSPIVCTHLWLDREVTESPFVGFIGSTTQWMFNKGRIFERRGERHAGYLSFVTSGARSLADRSNDEILDVVTSDLRAMIPAARDARVVKSLVLKEKNATMAPDPASDALRPPVRTPIANFFLAGDWIQTGLPATIESAVAAGHAAAREVLARIAA
jgi:squalene-associated FAD-dependent desaturase